MTCEIDLQNPPLQLVQVHVVNRILGILRRGERNKREPAMLGTWKVACSVASMENVAGIWAYLFVVRDLSVRWGAGLRLYPLRRSRVSLG